MSQNDSNAPPAVDLNWQSFPVGGGGGASSRPAVPSTAGAAIPPLPDFNNLVNIPGGTTTRAFSSTPLPPSSSSTTTNNNANLNSITWMSFFLPSFYQSLFNVDTADVVARLKLAIFPPKPLNFLRAATSPSSPLSSPFLSLVTEKGPDLYGPTWLLITLVCVIASGSQLSGWLNYSPPSVAMTGSKIIDAASSTASWRFDMTSFSSAIFVVYAFTLWAPLLLRATMAYVQVSPSPSLPFPTLMCIWGYGLTPYILAALLCVIPSSIFQWFVVVLAVCIALAHLASNIYVPLAQEFPGAGGRTMTGAGGGGGGLGAKTVLLMMLGLHITFALVMKLFFFTFTPAE